jgi:hypothetical protein
MLFKEGPLHTGTLVGKIPAGLDWTSVRAQFK